MTSICNLEKHKLKPLVSLFLKTGANFDEKFPKNYARPMKLFMQENIPSISVSDRFYNMEAVFTKECINDFRKNFSHLKFSHLRSRILYVQKWSFQLRHCNSRTEYQSWKNLQVFLVVEQFKVISHEMPSERQMKNSASLYKNEEIRSWIGNHRDKFIRNLLEQKVKDMNEFGDELALGTFKMPSLRSTCEDTSDQEFDKTLE